jgi:hypothetical protein
VDLAGLDGEVDAVVCDKITESLGDAAQFESQGALLGKPAGAGAAAAVDVSPSTAAAG